MGRAKKKLQRNEGDNKRWWFFWALLVALVGILVMMIWTITLYSNSDTIQDVPSFSSTGRVKGYKSSGEVKRKVLSSPHNSFAKKCAKDGVPLVIRNSVISKWKARKWTPSYMRSKFKVLSGIYENDNRWFGPYFDHSKPLLAYSMRRNSYKTNQTLSSDEFFHRLNAPAKDNFLYFTGGIEQMGEWADSEIEPIDELLVLNSKRSSINAWIGQPHVIAHCHYDGYHNFYAQLYGRKKFTLFSPTNWPGLYPYPFLHPSHAQAQVNASNSEDVERFPLVGMVEPLEAVLEPGDLLYIPPLWFHEVESLSVSISVNVWTDSHQTELVERLFSLTLPVNSAYESSHGHEHVQWHHGDHAARIGSAILIFRLIERVCKYRNCTAASKNRFSELSNEPKGREPYIYMIHQLWSTRYRDLMERGELPSIYGDNGDYILCKGEKNQDLQTVLKIDADILRDVHYGAYMEQVSQLVRGLPEETWELWLGNYVEYVVANAVSNVKYVGLFLKHFNTCAQYLK